MEGVNINFSNGNLQISGTDKNDIINIIENDGKIEVSADIDGDGKLDKQSFNKAEVKSLTVDTGKGDDKVQIGDGVYVDRVLTGDGDDKLINNGTIGDASVGLGKDAVENNGTIKHGSDKLNALLNVDQGFWCMDGNRDGKVTKDEYCGEKPEYESGWKTTSWQVGEGKGAYTITETVPADQAAYNAYQNQLKEYNNRVNDFNKVAGKDGVMDISDFRKDAKQNINYAELDNLENLSNARNLPGSQGINIDASGIAEEIADQFTRSGS